MPDFGLQYNLCEFHNKHIQIQTVILSKFGSKLWLRGSEIKI